jgi:hypothetical protein
MINEKLEKLKEKRDLIENLKSDLIDFTSDIFEYFYEYIFDKYSKLESFGWTQYTPYFSDGDENIFSANTDYILINGEWANDSKWLNKKNVITWGTWDREEKIYKVRVEEDNPNYDSVLSEANSEIINFLSNFDDEFYLRKFGNHAEIVVTKNGVDISDYEHD